MADSKKTADSGSCLLPLGAGILGFALLFGTLLNKGVLSRVNPVPDDFPAGKGEARCAYRECAKPPTGPVTFNLQVDEGTRGNKIVIFTDQKTAPLCAEHSDCARRHRWPDNPYGVLAFLLVTGVSAVAGLVAMGVAMMVTRPKGKPKLSSSSGSSAGSGRS